MLLSLKLQSITCDDHQYRELLLNSELQDKFSRPMPWIGIYIAVASLICTLAMAADLFHGLRNRKLWFPCKYFTLNAASLTLISVAMKLPLDLNNPMKGDIDQAAKIGSLAFMCTMMVNLMPSLATLDNKELLSNMIALAILIITVAVNVCIGITTGVVYVFTNFGSVFEYNKSVTIIYVAMLLFLLIVLTTSALTVPTAKSILEMKYQKMHKRASNDHQLKQTGIPTLEELMQHVRRHWVMAGTGSLQFVMATSPTCFAAGVICVSSFLMHIYTVIHLLRYRGYMHYESDYKKSTRLILVIQSVGIAVGSIAPVFRFFTGFTALSSKMSLESSMNLIKVFVVESYWMQKLSDWKQSRMPFPIGGCRLKIVVHNVIRLVLSFCMLCQKVIVVACKTIGLLSIFFVIFIYYCWKLLKAMFIASNNHAVAENEQHNTDKDLSSYVLKLQDEMEFAEIPLNSILKSLNRLIHKAEEQQPKNLMKLLELSTGFEGVERFDSDHVPSLLSEESPNCWSLPVITLTSIALALPNIQNDAIDGLLSSVGEGLVYVELVEETLNTKDDYVKAQKAANKLWLELEVYRKWLGNNLQKYAHNGKTSRETLEWLSVKAETMLVEFKKSTNKGPNEIFLDKLIASNSMYRISQSILHYYHDRIEQGEELFEQLSAMIADILSACLTNLPHVIAMKCYACAIEKREKSNEIAVQLLSQTKEIIENLQKCELPSLDADQLAFIDEWRAFLKHPIP